jgi:hypothetical protein
MPVIYLHGSVGLITFMDPSASSFVLFYLVYPGNWLSRGRGRPRHTISRLVTSLVTKINVVATYVALVATKV